MTGARHQGSCPSAASITEPLGRGFPPPGLVLSGEPGCCPALLATLRLGWEKGLKEKAFRTDQMQGAYLEPLNLRKVEPA